MGEKRTAEFKIVCENYFLTLSLNALRAYGRALKLQNPTEKKKNELIKELVSVLCGESVPKRKATGAPAKNDYVEPKIFQTVERLKREYLGEVALDEEIVAARPDFSVNQTAYQANASACETENGLALLRLEVCPALLTNKQRQLLNDFLNSL